MGSGKIQGKLWGQHPEDWAKIQEPTGDSGYEHVLRCLKLKPNQTLLARESFAWIYRIKTQTIDN